MILPAIFIVAALFGHTLRPMFGWGKRHVLNPPALRRPRRDVVIVALAGPAATLALAVIFGIIARLASGDIRRAALFATLVACFMTVVDLLPIPGRDGARILSRYLSPAAALKMQDLAQYDVLFLLGLFLILPLVANNITDPLFRLVTGI